MFHVKHINSCNDIPILLGRRGQAPQPDCRNRRSIHSGTGTSSTRRSWSASSRVAGASWVDIGSGAGLPGIVIATLVTGSMVLVEPRRLRADFLERTIEELGLGQRVSVAASNVQKVSGKFDVITARAVAALDRLLAISTHLSTGKTLWVLPKGRGAKSELAEARRSWQCEAETVPSCTDPKSEILLLGTYKARGGR
jgi:16S rRNA (guanine527-N7)-methyltransferase